ncbi:MAG: ADP-ribosylation factor-like protein [Desulfosalsimonadaceae bacterium]
MAILNLKSREIQCKIVYYGPGRSGKTTNLEFIHKHFTRQVAGKMISIDTHGDRTLFFDFLPMGLGKIKGCDIKAQLYTVPGQVQYRATRELVLKGVDGIVFVADSLKVRREKNMASLKDLHENLKKMGLDIRRVPLVFQYNKRDLDKQDFPLMPVEKMEHELNRQLKVPSFQASALTGEGVGPTLSNVMKLTLKQLQKEFQWAQESQ